MLLKSWIRNIFRQTQSQSAKTSRKSIKPKLQLLPLEDRIVPAVPFSPAFPHAISINTVGSATTTGDFSVTFNSPVTGVDTADFALATTGTAVGSISTVTGSGASYNVAVTGITGSGTLGLNLVAFPSITALTSFANQATFATGKYPAANALGDVNGDGKLDIVTSNYYADTTRVLLGNGDGTFASQATFATGKYPAANALGDVNGDGKLDIVTANKFSNNASVLLGNGDGTFAGQTTFATGASPRSVTLGDVNGDGKLDIVAANANSDNISVLLGNGDGTFASQATFADGNDPASITLGDVNGDGKLDLVTANYGANNASVFLGNGDGTFASQATLATGNSPISVTLGDVNGDGKLDIVAANFSANNTSVLLGNGDGTFASQATFAGGNGPISITLGDVNGDGKLDIVAANFSGINASVLLGNGNGTFGAQTAFDTGSYPCSVGLGDVNSDGRLDIVTANFLSDNVSVLLGSGTSATAVQFSVADSPTVGNSPISLIQGDVNGDGKFDIVTANLNSDNVSLLLGNGNGTFGTQAIFAAGDGPISVTLGDVNGDGKLDIVTANQNSNNTSVLLGNGNGTFQNQTTFAAESQPRSVTLGDVNGDGKLDIITANYNADNASVLLGNGNGTFGTSSAFETGDGPISVTLGDVNGDGRLDIVAANRGSQNTSVLLGNGNGTFGAQTTFATGNAPFSVTLGDVNGDGKLDIVTANFNTANTSVLLGNGDGTFQNQAPFAAGDSPTSVTLGDVNGDGRLDIVTSNYFANTTSVLLGNGNGTFGAQTTFAAGTSPVSVTLGDVNGDGRLDILTSNSNSNNVSVVLNSLAFTGQVFTLTSLVPSSTALTSSANPSVFGQAVTFTATVSGPSGTATGTVTFKDGSTDLGSVNLVAGVATLSTTLLAVDSAHSITAAYSGDSSYLVSTSNAVNQVVNATPALITGSAPPNGNDPANPGTSVNLYDPQTGQPNGVAVPFPNFMGQVRVASGDFNNDGTVEIVAAAGPGGGPAVTILDSSTGEPLFSFFAYDQAFTGGVFVAVEDVNNDGVADIITGAGTGGGPHVKIFNGATRQEMASFFAYAENFSGGVSVASTDINGDNQADIVTGAGPGGGPHVKVFDGSNYNLISTWFAYPVSFTGGVFVAIGDISNDDNFEVVTGAGQGGAPVVAVWNPFTGALQSQFMAYAEVFSGGVRVGVSDATGDGILDLVTGAGPGGSPHVKAFNYPNLDLLFEFFSGPETDPTGVFVS